MKKRTLTDAQVLELADYLQGTTNNLDDVTIDLFGVCQDELSFEDLVELDLTVFQCENCGWWADSGEMSDDPGHDWQCRDCASDGEPEFCED
jgi:hypothetical protein